MATRKNIIVHDDDVKLGDSFQIPANMTYDKAMQILRRKHEEAETTKAFAKEFKAKPFDGAHATMMVLREKFGITFGKTEYGFFTIHPPQMVTVKTSYKDTIQVPWGTIQIPTLDNADLQMYEVKNAELGGLFGLNVTAKNKFKKEVEGLFEAIETYLLTGSIYRGKAIIGHKDPDFLNLEDFASSEVVYSEDANSVLETTVWAPIKMTELFRKENIPRKRAVLLYGPYGTGKTLAGLLTAEIAVANNWTFISARPGRDNLEDVMRIARLYLPAVVFFEDVDNTAKPGESDAVTEMLDVFDGITAKGGELIVLMTTNHVEKIHKAMLRPGRLDALIEIGALDRVGVEKLIKAAVKPEKLDAETNYDAVYTAMDGFFPAFIREAVNRASSVAISRAKSGDYVIGTQDLRIAALSLKPQLDQMHKASEKPTRPQLDVALGNVVQDKLSGARMLYDGSGSRDAYVIEFNKDGETIEVE
jgi:transitional endoplasmic reticulum ATPase